MEFVGNQDTYVAESVSPFAIGRVSLLYQARASNGDTVCVKTFRDLKKDRNTAARLDSFLKELEAGRQLRHPQILPILDWGVLSDVTWGRFLVMPFCANGDLRSLLRQADYVPLADAIPILYRIAGAIDYSHGSGVIHGDIKPENILIADDRRGIFLADFGVWRAFDFEEQITTEMGFAVGTTAYLSPEQISGKSHTPRSDIYAFATVVFELLTGSLPIDPKKSPLHQLVAKMKGETRSAREMNPLLSPTVESALRSGLATEPADRPESATELCRMLSGEIESPGTRSWMQMDIRRRWARLDTGHKVTIVAAVVAAAATLAVGIINAFPALMDAFRANGPQP